MARPTKDQVEFGFWVVVLIAMMLWTIANEGFWKALIVFGLLALAVAAVEGITKLVRRLGR